MESVLLSLMIIAVLGIASQWVSWRFRLPAIVVMSIAGLLAGPITGFLHPKEVFGDLFNPIISLAVAVILFEGSLNLDFREVRGLERPVLRIVTIGAFIAWILGSLAAHYVAGLSWAVAFVIGGLFIVTGPTVILPLLRQARLKPRPAAILKWEGIIVDPFGALLSVFAFEIIKFMISQKETIGSLGMFFLASLLAAFFGWLVGKGLGLMLEKGHIPEFLKSPIVFASVLACFTLSDEIYHETGLLAVTAMGITLANMHISSISEMRYFKENISVLLISTIYIMLTSALSMDVLLQIFSWKLIGYVLLMLFIVRPLSIGISTIKTDMSTKEKTLVGWIAPRGIVALTVSGYFSSVLSDAGFKGAGLLTPLTLALVFSTVCAHGFSIKWLAKKLDLSIGDEPGVLIVGGNPFTVGLAKIFQELELPTVIADSSWSHLVKARNEGVKTYRGEILSEQTEFHLDLTPYEYLIAATDLDSYNALVCTTFIPELGRNNLFQLSLRKNKAGDVDRLEHTIGGRILFKEEATWEMLNDKMEKGYVFRKTTLSDQYDFDQYLEERKEGTVLLFIHKSSRKIEFFTDESELKGDEGDLIVSLAPPEEVKAREERDKKE
ncbi:cation:proton antiporter [Falsibacillus pallidus]|uniref:Sodium/proton antiporter (CPA1 family) n=1 Tax=Falsibacillus pallidus TaxID=493781 RepID=A0A370GE25_9BACI|nr:sodium:proton antiporter [Falsibacillus pallidus]RDI41931.1 sodium/proton antiporter (CPA1 family) [Falsibacillus pallidus]